MKSERDILTKVDHPFVVSLWFAFQTEKKLFLVMDFLAGGELFFHLKRRGLILEKEARFYLAEMILAIDFLHNIGVIHRFSGQLHCIHTILGYIGLIFVYFIIIGI